MRLLLRRRFFRLLAASANEYDLELCHFDADGVFLRVDLKEDLFMRLPEGCGELPGNCLLYTSPSPRDLSTSRMPSSA